MSSSLDHYLQMLEPHLNHKDTKDLCINPNGSVFLDTPSGWHEVECERLNPTAIQSLCSNIASYLRLPLSEKSPVPGGTVPTGHRVQIVAPPTLTDGFSVTFRRPSDEDWSVEDLFKKGMFDAVIANAQVSHRHEGLIEASEHAMSVRSLDAWVRFFTMLAESKLNIIFSGPMGSGKTTLAKAVMQLIPQHERILTLEDAREMSSANRKNIVHLMYQREVRDGFGLLAGDVLQVSLRMKGQRICLSELRGAEAYSYLVNAFGAHPGSISTTHANSAKEAYERLTLLCLENQKAQALGYNQIKELVGMAVDVVIQTNTVYDAEGKASPKVEQIYFSPRITRP
jgi:type IV secretion system protein VirB11